VLADLFGKINQYLPKKASSTEHALCLSMVWCKEGEREEGYAANICHLKLVEAHNRLSEAN